MSLRTKWSYAEECLLALRPHYMGRDLQIDPREVLLKLDSVTNSFAKQGFLANWKLRIEGVDDQYITTWENLTITDPSNNGPSYFSIPAHYADLPENQGIDQVYFYNDFSTNKKKYFDPVIITSFKDVSTFRGSIGRELEGRLQCYPKNGVMYFTVGGVAAKYGTACIRLVVKDSGAIADDAPYPIPADMEESIKQEVIKFFIMKMSRPADLIKDSRTDIKE